MKRSMCFNLGLLKPAEAQLDSSSSGIRADQCRGIPGAIRRLARGGQYFVNMRRILTAAAKTSGQRIAGARGGWARNTATSKNCSQHELEYRQRGRHRWDADRHPRHAESNAGHPFWAACIGWKWRRRCSTTPSSWVWILKRPWPSARSLFPSTQMQSHSAGFYPTPFLRI